jgi:hypothetical protein
LGAESAYPVTGALACEVLEQMRDADGRELMRISTEKPLSAESEDGLSEFVVMASDVEITPW